MYLYIFALVGFFFFFVPCGSSGSDKNKIDAPQYFESGIQMMSRTLAGTRWLLKVHLAHQVLNLFSVDPAVNSQHEVSSGFKRCQRYQSQTWTL